MKKKATVHMSNENLNDSNLDLIAKDGLRAWISISQYILEVDQKRSWSHTHRTFTDWLIALSSKLSLAESSLWRYYQAGKYYQTLRQSLIEKDVDTPPFELLGKKVSSENLEILEKIERVVPEKVFMDLAVRVIKCAIKRNELRGAWAAYRDVLGGKTARGVGVNPPRVDLTDRLQALKVNFAQVLTTLNSASKNWTAFSEPQIFKILPEIRIKTDGAIGGGFVMDVVILFQGDSRSEIELFGVDIKSNNGLNTKYDSLVKQGPYFDRVWVAFYQFNEDLGIRNIPEHIGVLALDDGGFRLVRSAQHSPLMGKKSIGVAKILLGKLVKS